jgi:hypothetical protein
MTIVLVVLMLSHVINKRQADEGARDGPQPSDVRHMPGCANMFLMTSAIDWTGVLGTTHNTRRGGSFSCLVFHGSRKS